MDTFDLLTFRAAEDVGLREKLAKGTPLRVKFGVDPTAAHVTLGWGVVLRQLRRFQDLGHQAVLIVGDFTAQVGDPSGRNATRPMLSAEQVQVYSDHVLQQFGLILDLDRTEVRRNSEWLSELGVKGLLELASHATVHRILERDDFEKRFKAHEPISVMELLYPLLQGYDSVAIRADVELGGTDQLFNLMAGRDMQRIYGQEPQAVLTMPLLEGTDGVQKMSQSLGNYVGITEPADEIFGKLMRIPDGLLGKYLRLTTDLLPDEIEPILAEPPQQAKRRLAREVVALYHGPEAGQAALDHWDKVIAGKQLPDDIESRPIPPESVIDGRVIVPRLLKELFGVSSADGKRLLQQKGVKLDGEVWDKTEASPDDVRGKVLQVGSHRFVKLA